jgi:hypothetical protein
MKKYIVTGLISLFLPLTSFAAMSQTQYISILEQLISLLEQELTLYEASATVTAPVATTTPVTQSQGGSAPVIVTPMQPQAIQAPQAAAPVVAPVVTLSVTQDRDTIDLNDTSTWLIKFSVDVSTTDGIISSENPAFTVTNNGKVLISGIPTDVSEPSNKQHFVYTISGFTLVPNANQAGTTTLTFSAGDRVVTKTVSWIPQPL